MKYVVRNNNLSEADPPMNYLGKSRFCTSEFADAVKFDSLKEARAAAKDLGYSGRAVYEVTWVVKYDQLDDEVHHYWPNGDDQIEDGDDQIEDCSRRPLCQSLKTARRWPSKEEALAFWPHKQVWKVVRVLKKVK